jgi:hypothetical protein
MTSLLSEPHFTRSWPIPLELNSSCSATSQLMVAMARSKVCNSLEPISDISGIDILSGTAAA